MKTLSKYGRIFNSSIDNYIDFGINDIDENNPDIPLDFNIDGYIADKF